MRLIAQSLSSVECVVVVEMAALKAFVVDAIVVLWIENVHPSVELEVSSVKTFL